MTICETIEKETGQYVNLDTPIDDILVDSLEYLDLCLTLGVDSSKTYQTVGDMAREMA